MHLERCASIEIVVWSMGVVPINEIAQLALEVPRPEGNTSGNLRDALLLESAYESFNNRDAAMLPNCAKARPKVVAAAECEICLSRTGALAG